MTLSSTTKAGNTRGPIVPERLILDPRLQTLSGRALRVLLYLLNCRNRRTGLCCPRQKTIAEDLGLGARQRVAESIRRLKDLGFLEVTYGWTKKARRKITCYSFPHLDHCPDKACNPHADECPEEPCNPPADKGTDSGDNCPGNPCRQMHGSTGHRNHGRGTTEVLNHTLAAKPPLDDGEILTRLKKRGVTESVARRMIAEDPQRALAAADTAGRLAEKENQRRMIGAGLIVNWFYGRDDPPESTGGLLSNRAFHTKNRERVLRPDPTVERLKQQRVQWEQEKAAVPPAQDPLPHVRGNRS